MSLSDSDFSDCDEAACYYPEGCQDLFSSKVFESPEKCLENAKLEHNIDFKSFLTKFDLDDFSFIQLINYLRSEKPSPSSVQQWQPGQEKSWKQEKYMKPVIENDALLMFDIDELRRSKSSESSDATKADDDDDMPELSESGRDDLVDQFKHLTQETVEGAGPEDYKEMLKTLGLLRSKLQEKDQQIEKMLEDMSRMKSVTQSLLSEDAKIPMPDGSDPAALAKIRPSNEVISVSEAREEADDQSYAGSYAHFAIHHEMLSDQVRTESYRDAVLDNPSELTGKHVLDLGCGTSILSMFCAKAGAASVVGVDMSDILHQAMDIIHENGLQDKITLVKGRLEDQKDLPRKKFDIIISEWMGYFLLFEGMLDSVIDAREKYLVPGGRVLPNRCTIRLVGISDLERYANTVDYWKNVYGFKMSCMKKPGLVEGSVEVVPKSKCVTNSILVHTLNMETCSVQDTQFSTDFTMTAERDCELTGIAGYFDTFFDMADKPVWFTTGPAGTPTHWKQTVFYLKDKMTLTNGQEIKGRIEVVRPRENARGLRVKLLLNGKEQNYTVE